MKQGKTIQELALEIQRQQNSKRDFLIDTGLLEPFVSDNEMKLGWNLPNGNQRVDAGLSSNGHIQLANFCDIPKKYYDSLLKYPELLQQNVAHWLKTKNSKKTIRTLDGNVRAILGDRYRRLDNYELSKQVLPMLFDADAQIESSEITENKLYIKAITHKVQGEVKTGDVVSAGILISNSETGHGSLSVKPLVYRLVCKNGAIADDYAMRKYHVGRGEELNQIEFSNETISADDNAFWLKVRDLVKFSLSETTFDKIVDSMRESTTKKIANPTDAIELVSKKYGFSKEENDGVLAHLIAGGDLSSWGLGNAVTRMAQDVSSYDRSTELESIGFVVMQNSWN